MIFIGVVIGVYRLVSLVSGDIEVSVIRYDVHPFFDNGLDLNLERSLLRLRIKVILEYLLLYLGAAEIIVFILIHRFDLEIKRGSLIGVIRTLIIRIAGLFDLKDRFFARIERTYVIKIRG